MVKNEPMSTRTKRIVWFLVSALVVGLIGEILVKRTYFADEVSRGAISYVLENSAVEERLGILSGAKVVRRRSYALPPKFEQDVQEITLRVEGGNRIGNVVIVYSQGVYQVKAVE